MWCDSLLTQVYIRQKFGKKCFSIRALRFLHQQVAGELSLKETGDLPAEYFAPGSSSRAVHDFYRNLTRVEDEISSGFDDTDPTEPLSDWQALAAEIAARAGAMAAPDVSEAAILLDLAAALKSACASAQEIAARAELLTQRRRTVAEQLATIADDLRVPVLEALANADEPLLDRLEAIVPELDAVRSRADQVATKYDELRSRKAEADRVEDWDRSAELIAALREAKASRDAARKEYADRLSDVRSAVCAPERSDEPEPESAAANPESIIPARPEIQPDPAPAEPETGAIELPVEAPGAIGSSKDTRRDGSTEAEESGRESAADRAGIRPTSDIDEVAEVTVARGPVHDLDHLLATYLDRGDAALAWHLASLAEERGHEPGVPSAVLKALAVAPAFLRPADIADARKQEILADSMAAVTAAEQSGDDRKADRARVLAFAALLQPALFDMGQIGRPYLKMLSMTGSLAPLAPLSEALSNLGYDVQLSSEDLVELSGTERQRRLPAAISALSDWLRSARAAKTVHQPTYRILHWLLAPGGTLGRVLEGAIADAPDAVREVGELVSRLLDNRAEQERLGHVPIGGVAGR